MLGGCGSLQLKSYTKATNSFSLRTSNIEKTIYLVLINDSSHPTQLDSLLRLKLAQKGYKLVSDAKNASFSLTVTPVKISNDNGTDFEFDSVLKIGENVEYSVMRELIRSSSAESSVMTAAAGLVMTSFVGTLAYLTADGNIRMQVDVNITQTGNKEYYTRVLSEAERMQLDINVAQPILEGNISDKIVSFFGQ